MIPHPGRSRLSFVRRKIRILKKGAVTRYALLRAVVAHDGLLGR
jgi:hypothetical protein